MLIGAHFYLRSDVVSKLGLQARATHQTNTDTDTDTDPDTDRPRGSKCEALLNPARIARQIVRCLSSV